MPKHRIRKAMDAPSPGVALRSRVADHEALRQRYAVFEDLLDAVGPPPSAEQLEQLKQQMQAIQPRKRQR
jgi:hypothetical protein